MDMQSKRITDLVRTDEVKNTQVRCVLTIQAPRHRCDKFKNILNPVLRHFDPSSLRIQVSRDETLFRNLPPERGGQNGGNIPRYQDNRNILSTPALSVMMFLQERGTTTAQDVQKLFKRHPWRIHHKIELQNKRSPTVKVGQQEFYSLSREYPLWSVCPVYAGFEHLRLCLFVTRFSEMVEFYRLVTDSEMESTKPDFCLFPVCSEDEFQVMLCLKRCRQLRPFPLTRAYLSFKVRNIVTLKNLPRSDLQEISHNRYLIKDPDGNLVLLEDMNITSPNSVEYENDFTTHISDVSCDVTSVKSVCGSHDSGRYSDSDQCASELEHKAMKKIVHFSDTKYEKLWTYDKHPRIIQNDQIPKHFHTPRPQHSDNNTIKPEPDLSFEDYYIESSQRCYPGMVIAHARLINNQNEQSYVADDIGDSTLEHVKPPIVTVTDCSGNVHNCIERVIYPSESCHDQPVPYDSYEGQFESRESTGLTEGHGVTFYGTEGEAVPGRGRSNRETGLSRRQYEGQNCDLGLGQEITVCRPDDDRGSCPWARDGVCDSGGLKVPPGPWGCESIEKGNQLREEVNKKRLVKPVYI